MNAAFLARARAFEALGVALGRACLADPGVHRAVVQGFTRAVIHEQAARRALDAPADALAALEAAGDEVARVFGVPPASGVEEVPRSRRKIRARPRTEPAAGGERRRTRAGGAKR